MEEDIELRISTLKNSAFDVIQMLNVAYDNVYMKAIGRGKQPARRHIVDVALKWTLCSFRPLTLDELVYACAIQSDGSLRQNISPGKIVFFCSNLLVEGSGRAVRFAHLSVKHYLERKKPPDYSPLEAHTQAAIGCLFFMKSPEYHEISTATLEISCSADSSLVKSFSTYVRSYWSRHCREAKKSTQLTELEDGIKQHELERPTKTQPTTPTVEGNTKSTANTASLEPSESPKSDPDPLQTSDYAETGDSVQRNQIIEKQSQSLALLDDREVPIKTEANHSPRASLNFPEVISIAKNTLDGKESVADEYFTPDSSKDSLSIQLGLEEPSTDLGNLVEEIQLDAERPRFDSIYSAIRHGDVIAVEKLIATNVDLDVVDEFGNTPLHEAVRWNKLQILERFIDVEANIDVQNTNGDTPLHIAAYFGFKEILLALIAAGADRNSLNKCDGSPLSLSITQGEAEIERILLLSGARPVTMDKPSGLVSGTGMLRTIRSFLRPITRMEMPKRQFQQGQINSQDVSSIPRPKIPKLQFSDLCDYCDMGRWLQNSGNFRTHRHWPSYADLVDSSKSGCRLCALFAKEFENQGGAQLSDKGEPSHVAISLSLCSESEGPGITRDILRATMGDVLELHFELCIDPSKLAFQRC
jgi:hypothetical protein